MHPLTSSFDTSSGTSEKQQPRLHEIPTSTVSLGRMRLRRGNGSCAINGQFSILGRRTGMNTIHLYAPLTLPNRNLQALRQDLSSYQKTCPGRHRICDSPYRTIDQDIEQLISQAQLQSQSLQARLDMAVSSMNSQQARKSVQETSSTRRQVNNASPVVIR